MHPFFVANSDGLYLGINCARKTARKTNNCDWFAAISFNCIEARLERLNRLQSFPQYSLPVTFLESISSEISHLQCSFVFLAAQQWRLWYLLCQRSPDPEISIKVRKSLRTPHGEYRPPPKRLKGFRIAKCEWTTLRTLKCFVIRLSPQEPLASFNYPFQIFAITPLLTKTAGGTAIARHLWMRWKAQRCS